MSINNDSLIIIDAQINYLPLNNETKEIINKIKLNIINAIENNKTIIFITKRDKLDGEGIILNDDTEILVDGFESIIEKHKYENVLYLSKEGTPLFQEYEKTSSKIEETKNFFENIKNPLLSGCFTAVCQFAVARDLINHLNMIPIIDFKSSYNGIGENNFDEINSLFEKLGYKGLLA